MSKLNALLVTGPSCSGQTTLTSLLNQLLDPRQATGRVQVIDVRDLIVWGKRLRTPIGNEVRKHAGPTITDQNLPDELFVSLFLTWLEDARIENRNLKLVLGSGFPRSLEQLAILHEFSRSLIIHIQATMEEASAAMRRRLTESPEVQSRAGYDENVFMQEMADYVNRTRPALARLNGNVAEVKRSDPLLGRLHKTFHFLLAHQNSPVDSSMSERALKDLRKVAHPIHHAIRNIEGSKGHLGLARDLQAQVHS